MITLIGQTDCQQVSISGASAQTTNAVKADKVGLFATCDCFIAIGANPTATASGDGNIFLPEGFMMATECKQGDKVAAITSGATGTLYTYPLR